MERKRSMWKRLLSLTLALAMVLAMAPAYTATAATTAPKTLYLKPNSNWIKDGARFAAYFFGNGEKWVSMTDSNNDGIYEVAVPSGYPNVIFCRMNGGASANNWDNKWNQTGDLTVPSDEKDLFTVPNDSWNGATTTWSTYTLTIAGTISPAGWSPENGEKLTQANGFKHTYTKVQAGRYEFKVTDGTWNKSWPNNNYIITVDLLSDVTITFNPSTSTINVDVVPVTYTVEFSGTNIDFSNNTSTPVKHGASFSTTLSVGDGYKLPQNVEVQMGGSSTDAYSYNPANGTLTIPSVTDDITITANGVKLGEFGVTLRPTGVTAPDAASSVREGSSYTATFVASTYYDLPASITVVMNDITLTAGEDYTYDASSGVLTIPNVNGEIIITAAGVPQTNTIYFENNWKWPDLKIYWWGSSIAENPTWPGVEMDKVDSTLSGNDRYSIEVPVDAKGIIFSGTGEYGFEQCSNIESGWYDGVCYRMAYNSPSDTKTAEPYRYTPTVLPEEPITDVTIHFRNTALWRTVNTYVWDFATNALVKGEWPGVGVMENSEHKNWYTVTLHGFEATKGIGVIFNGIGGQTENIEIAANGEYWYDALNGGLTNDEPDPEIWADGSVPMQAYKVTLHFANTKNWGGVNLYTWNAASLPTGPWPGSTVGLDENGFYSLDFTYEAPEGQNLNFVFSGSGSQTVDLSLPFSAFTKDEYGAYWAEKWVAPTSTDSEGKYYADIVSSADAIALPPVVNGNTVTIQYKGSASDTVELFGTMNNWSPGYTAAKNEHGVFTFTLDDLPVGIHRYKLVINGSWVLDPLNSWIYTENDGTQNSAFLISNPEADTNRVSIKIHYAAPSSEWNVSAWGANDLAPQYDFENGIATIVLDGRDAQYVCFKIRKSIAGNKWAEQSGEMRVDLANIVSGTIDVWVAGDHSSSQTMDADVVITNKINSVELDYDNNAIIIRTYKAVADPETAFAIYKNGAKADIITGITVSGSTYTLTLSETLDLVNLWQYSIRFAEQVKFTEYDYSIGINTVYASDKFADEFTYTGSDLGAIWDEDTTTFRVWAPTAASVSLMLYRSGTAGTEDLIFEVPMTQGQYGTWYTIASGSLNGTYYTYYVNVNGKGIEAVDPYARTTGVNGQRGMVIDLDSTDPEGWENDVNPNPSTSYTDAIIYELHVRDFSIDSSSGILEDYRGKFLAFTLEGTTVNGQGNYATGIDYLKNLGITHVHLLPVYDYGSVDETKCDTFNWGYDPVNYNVPEGSYSTDPYKAEVRVAEFKRMVKALHDAGISVIMDVVYNHVYDAGQFCFNQIVPGYFSRFNADGSYSNGSGCGNDTASEREMVRKYIVESVNYWSEEYHIDGFRFDLVGLIDATTINQIVDTVHEDRPDTIFYGEGWTMGTAVEPGNDMATQGNSGKTPGFAYFSDTIRNLLAGSNGSSLGFASGLTGKETDIRDNFMAKPGWSNNPTQIVQYASCHDNYTLIDKLILSTGKSRIDADIIKMNNLAAAIYMTSQGIPFIHAGEEMLREKLEEDGGRCENSYNASDYVNSIKWSKLNDATCRANVEYYRGLIELRKTHQALRLDTRAAIDANVAYRWITNEVVMFTINASAVSDISDKIIVIFNATNASANVSLPSGTWKICVNGTAAGTDVLSTTTGSVSVAGRSAMVLVQGAAKLVTVTLQDGETVSTITQKDNGVAQLPEDPEKEGYTFLGWFDAEGNRFTGAMPAADTVYTAKWEANDITLTFNVMEYDVLTVTKKAGSAYEFEAAEPTKIGHNFAGWFDADGNEYVGIVPTVDTTYYARWEAKDITLTFMDGDTLLDTQTQKADTEFAIELAPTKEGYTFLGWFTEDSAAYDGWVPVVNTTYYASWEALSYDLTLNAGPGGEVEISDNKPDCGDTVTITVTPDEGKLLHSIAATANGAEVKLTANPDGTYSFTQPAGEVTVTVTFRDDIPSGSDEQPEDNAPEGGEAPVLPQPEAPDWEDLREPVADLGDSFVQVVQMAVNILQMLFQVPLRLLGFLGSLIH